MSNVKRHLVYHVRPSSRIPAFRSGLGSPTNATLSAPFCYRDPSRRDRLSVRTGQVVTNAFRVSLRESGNGRERKSS